jgi:bla regulator protein blaR1
MMPIAWDAWSSWLAGRLLTGSLQGAVAVGIVWLICRRFPAIPASVRAHAWWIVSLGLLLSLSALPSLPLPLLPGPLALVDSTDGNRLAPASNDTASMPPHTASSEGHHEGVVAQPSRWWVSVVIALWMAGVLVHAYRLVSAYASLRGAVRRSVPLLAGDGAHADRAAVAMGLTHTPPIRLSQEIAAPLVTGIVRPVVLIPTLALDDLSAHERALAIAHELAHIRRFDLLFAWVPAIAERLFFFHPLARLVAREYAAARESACDALVINTMDVAPQEYGRMLVRLGVGVNTVFTLGGSSPSLSSLKRRLDMLHDASFDRSSRATIALVVLVAMLAVLPLHVVARTEAAPQNAAAASPPAAAQTPAKPVPPAKPQPAAPAAPRPVARSNGQEPASIEQAIAEQRRNMQRIEEALNKMRLDLQALYAKEREQRQVEATRLAQEAVRKQVESARRDSEVQNTTQFLENQLRMLTAEREETDQRLRTLSAEIESLKQKLDQARRAQELESIRPGTEKK